MPKFIIPVEKDVTALEQIKITEAIQEIVRNIDTQNIELLGKKSRGKNINRKIQQYKNLI